MKQLNDYNKIMFINGGKELSTVTLKVQSDTYEYPVVVNGIECTFCGFKEHPDIIRAMGDTDMCDACYEGMVA